MAHLRDELGENFGGGRFDLTPRVAKIVRLAEGTDNDNVRHAAVGRLWRFGYFLDKAGVLWDRSSVPRVVRECDPRYAELAGVGAPV